jgi:FdrA protein
VVSGVGLGFANVVRPGPVGIVAASGTGAQHLMTLLDSADIGVTHCLGVGGRDLSAAVGGLSTMVALERLASDPGVELIVVLSKPPAPEVATSVGEFAAGIGTPVVMGVLGPGRPDLTRTAENVAAALGVSWQTPQRWGPESGSPRPGYLRGLFSGGTLCDEAMLAAVDRLGTVVSNIPLAGQPALDSDLAGSGHVFIDFGDDQLTVGRPHPMIDATLRLERLQRELADPDCAVVLLDVVLGHGAHLDPAADLAAAIDGAAKPVVVSLVGTRDDPQGRDGQAQRLAAAGAVVHASNAAAIHEALGLIGGKP